MSYKQKLIAFYQNHAPEKIATVDAMLQQVMITVFDRTRETETF